MTKTIFILTQKVVLLEFRIRMIRYLEIQSLKIQKQVTNLGRINFSQGNLELIV